MAVLAIGTSDGRVRLVDVATGEMRVDVLAHTRAVHCVTLSPNGKAFASGGRDTSWKLWDAVEGSILACMRGHSGDGECICDMGGDGRRRRLNPGCPQPGHFQWVDAISMAPCGNRVATGGRDGVGMVWNLLKGNVDVRVAGHRDSIRSLCFSPDGTRLATGGADGDIFVWDANSGAQVFAMEGAHRSLGVESVVWAPCGRKIASGGRDFAVRIWDAASGAELVALCGHDDEVPPCRPFPVRLAPTRAHDCS
jgi:WD40 repeat protein